MSVLRLLCAVGGRGCFVGAGDRDVEIGEVRSVVGDVGEGEGEGAIVLDAEEWLDSVE